MWGRGGGKARAGDVTFLGDGIFLDGVDGVRMGLGLMGEEALLGMRLGGERRVIGGGGVAVHMNERL